MARILVVDDDPPILNLVGAMLRKRGHLVVGVGSPQEAIDLLENREPPDVLVTDVAMPGMSGLELVNTIRQRDGLADLPVIFLSARVDPLDVESGRALGAVYLTKPFIANALFGAIDRVLEPVGGTW